MLEDVLGLDLLEHDDVGVHRSERAAQARELGVELELREDLLEVSCLALPRVALGVEKELHVERGYGDTLAVRQRRVVGRPSPAVVTGRDARSGVAGRVVRRVVVVVPIAPRLLGEARGEREAGE